MAQNPYGSQTQSLLSQAALGAGGYEALPGIQRSQYLADALRALQESANQNIKTPAALGSNLLAEALLQYGRRRSEKTLIDQLKATQASGVQSDESAAFGSPQLGAAPQAPADSPPPPPEPPAAIPSPPVAQAAPTSPRAQMMAELIKGGLKPMAAAALVGQFGAESGPNLNRDNPAEGAIGAANWQGPRRTAAQAYFAAHGGPTPANQAAFALQELPTSAGLGPQGFAALQSAPDVASAAAIANGYERPRGYRPGGNPANVSGWQTRLSGAQDAYSQYQPQAAPQAPQASPGPQTPQSPPMAPQGAPAPQQTQSELPALMGLPANSVERQQIMVGLSARPGSDRYNEAAQRLHEIALRTSQQRPYHIVNQNGVNVAIDDMTGQQRPLPVPGAVMNRTMDASQAGINAPAGTSMTVDPLGKPTVVTQPQAGYATTNQPGQPYSLGAVRGGPQDPAAGQSAIDNAKSLNERFRSDVNPIVSVTNGYGQIRSALSQGTTAADQAALVAYMRLINPQARVQAGQLAPMDGTVPEQFAAILNRLTQQSGTMTPDERHQLLQAATPIYQQAQAQYEAIAKNYRQRASAIGADPGQIVEPLPPIDAPSSQGGHVRTYNPATGRIE